MPANWTDSSCAFDRASAREEVGTQEWGKDACQCQPRAGMDWVWHETREIKYWWQKEGQSAKC